MAFGVGAQACPAARFTHPGAFSSVGRAPARQAGGHWFEPSNAHPRRACRAKKSGVVLNPFRIWLYRSNRKTSTTPYNGNFSRRTGGTSRRQPDQPQCPALSLGGTSVFEERRKYDRAIRSPAPSAGHSNPAFRRDRGAQPANAADRHPSRRGEDEDNRPREQTNFGSDRGRRQSRDGVAEAGAAPSTRASRRN